MFTIAIDGTGGDLGHVPILQALTTLKSQANWIIFCKDPAHFPNYNTIVCEDAITAMFNHQFDACISAGDTGKYLLTALRSCKRLVRRTPLVSIAPSIHGDKVLLDMGANISCTAEDLLHFAALGKAYAQALDIGDKVGFLNIGTEEHKGPGFIRDARALYETHFGPSMFIEPDQLFVTTCDVIVMDGYAGNLVIKAGAGVGQYIKQILHNQPIWSKLLAYPLLRSLKQSMNTAKHNTAVLMGLDRLVVKAHGNSTAEAFEHSLKYTLKMAKVFTHMTQLVHEYLARVTTVKV